MSTKMKIILRSLKAQPPGIKLIKCTHRNLGLVPPMNSQMFSRKSFLTHIHMQTRRSIYPWPFRVRHKMWRYPQQHAYT